MQKLNENWDRPVFYVIERYKRHGAHILQVLSGPISGNNAQACALVKMENWRKFVPKDHELTIADIRFDSDVLDKSAAEREETHGE